jgi:hypothetical protein
MTEQARAVFPTATRDGVGGLARRWAIRPGHAWPIRGRVTALWLVLSVATAAAVCSTEFPPFYDYYQWLYQGHVVSALLFGTDAPDITGDYELTPVPVPNLAAPVLIGLLNTVLSIEVAGTVFLTVTALGFAAAFGYLVRTIQRRPTTAEFLGFPWAMGFFLYKGYLSYEFAIAGMFVLVAVLHRFVGRSSAGRGRTLPLVAGLGVLLYLSHLLAWVMGGLAVLAYALVVARRGRRWVAVQLVACMAPGVALAAWYVIAERGGTGAVLYASWQDKAIALTETFQFFLRLDPFPPAFPLFWVNALLALAFGAVVLLAVDLSRLRTTFTDRPVLWLSAALAVIALGLPVSSVNDLIKPDERFVAPALLLAIAALPYRPGQVRRTALGAALAAIVIGLHLVEYADVSPRIARIDAAVDATVPGQARVLHLAVPARYGCDAAAGPVTGEPVLKWFAVDHALEGGPPGVNVEETSVVHTRNPAALDTTVLAADSLDLPTAALATAAGYSYFEVIGCPADIQRIGQVLAPAFRPAAQGEAYAIFERR